MLERRQILCICASQKRLHCIIEYTQSKSDDFNRFWYIQGRPKHYTTSTAILQIYFRISQWTKKLKSLKIWRVIVVSLVCSFSAHAVEFWRNLTCFRNCPPRLENVTALPCKIKIVIFNGSCILAWRALRARNCIYFSPVTNCSLWLLRCSHRNLSMAPWLHGAIDGSITPVMRKSDVIYNTRKQVAYRNATRWLLNHGHK